MLLQIQLYSDLGAKNYKISVENFSSANLAQKSNLKIKKAALAKICTEKSSLKCPTSHFYMNLRIFSQNL